MDINIYVVFKEFILAYVQGHGSSRKPGQRDMQWRQDRNLCFCSIFDETSSGVSVCNRWYPICVLK